MINVHKSKSNFILGSTILVYPYTEYLSEIL